MAVRRPILNTSMTQKCFMYPLGAVVSEPLPQVQQPQHQSGGSSFSASPAPIASHSRSQSNATLVTADIRLGMTRSITNLFSSMGEVQNAEFSRSIDDFTIYGGISALNLPCIHHLFQNMQFRGEDGVCIISVPDFDGRTRRRIIQRPVPMSRISGLDDPDISTQVMNLWSLFVQVMVKASEELICLTFAAGKPATQLQRIATTALTKAASDIATFERAYKDVVLSSVTQWLYNYDFEDWDFVAQTVPYHGFSSILHKELTNTMFQQWDEWTNDFREGSKIIVQRYSLFGAEAKFTEQVDPPGLRLPRAHSKQALRLLALICNIQNPDDLNITHLTPSPEFLVSEAVERMIAAAIYAPGVMSFALMVESKFDPSEDSDPNMPPKVKYPGLRWMPVHLISYAATFIIMELVRIANFDNMGGLDIIRATSIHLFSTYDTFINTSVTDTVQMYYDLPKSEAGVKIHQFLEYLDREWRFNLVAQRHREEVKALARELSQGSILH